MHVAAVELNFLAVIRYHLWMVSWTPVRSSGSWSSIHTLSTCPCSGSSHVGVCVCVIRGSGCRIKDHVRSYHGLQDPSTGCRISVRHSGTEKSVQDVSKASSVSEPLHAVHDIVSRTPAGDPERRRSVLGS